MSTQRGEFHGGRLTRRGLLRVGVGATGGLALAGTGWTGSRLAFAAPGLLQSEPKQGGTLRLALAHEPDSLDPHYLLTTEAFRIVEQLYSSLVSLDKDMNIVPDVAEEWTINDDATQFDFKIRKGIMFHHGRELEAADVEYTARRLADGSPYEYIFRDLDQITVPDKSTITFTFKRSAAHFLAAMSPRWTGIVAKEIVEKAGLDGMKTSASGSGPFKLVEWNPLQQVVVERNESYWEPGLPYLDQIIWTPVEDEVSRVNQVTSGTMDLDIDGPGKLFDTYAGASDLEVLEGPVCSFLYCGFNAARPPFDKKEARQAVAWALDRQQIVDFVANGHGVPITGGPIGPDTHWAYNGLPIYTAPDPEKAKSLLQQAGVAEGTEVVLVTTSGGAWADIAQVIQQQLAPVGINVKIEAIEGGAANTRVFQEHDFDLTIRRWGTMIDPNDFTGEFFYSTGSYNFGQLNDPKIDELLDKGIAVANQEERKQVYAEIEQYLAADAVPYAFLYRPTVYAAYHGDVKDLQHETANTRLSLKQVWLDR
ncbi:MAG: peptide/nickel transport system substrate-binding protein [Thermomicrobiales bacterium]|nr:peptide/nickel transport system substrate-binding protein [Thermomicrobiales bacterium]